jgi:hypothetical protein
LKRESEEETKKLQKNTRSIALNLLGISVLFPNPVTITLAAIGGAGAALTHAGKIHHAVKELNKEIAAGEARKEARRLRDKELMRLPPRTLGGWLYWSFVLLVYLSVGGYFLFRAYPNAFTKAVTQEIHAPAEPTAPITPQEEFPRTVTAKRDLTAKLQHGTLTVQRGKQFTVKKTDSGKLIGEKGSLQFPVTEGDFE